ncbi:TonB-dependent receptor [Pseudoduganella lurida]|nr:TonB-dependent receptor [Pseudoduganella lurida]
MRPLPALLLGAFIGQLGCMSLAAAQQQPATTAPAATRPAPAQPAPSSPPAAGTVSATPTDPAKKPEQPAEQPGSSGAEMQTVTVVAERASELIDRSVYDVKAEVITPNASASDVIANVPNVTVDQDGKVAIRGQQNTQIFVNGKRSAMFSGENGGDALNSYPADALESVEVITTPGAEFGSEGGGGPILNLITRRVRPQGGRATISGSVGADGRYNTSVNGSYNEGRLQVDGNVNFMRNVQERNGYSDTVTQTSLGEQVAHRDSISRTPSRTITMNPTFSYNVGDTDRASAMLNFSHSERDGNSNDYYVTRLLGAPYEEYNRYIDRDSKQTVYQLSLGYEHKPNRDEEWKYDLRASGNNADSNNANRNTYVVTPPGGPRIESTNGSENNNRTADFTMDYKKRFNPQVTMRAGFKVGVNNGQTDADYFNIDPLTGEEVIVDDRASAFKVREKSYAVYLTPSFRLSQAWVFMPGIRYERVDRDVDYINQNNSSKDTSKKVLPNASLQYAWGDSGAAVVGSWSRRINRPSKEDINPNVTYVDDYNYSEGDPRIAPTHTNNYELKYTDTWLGANTNLSLFRTVSTPLIGRFLTPVPDSTAVLSQTVNYGERQSTGVSLNVQAKPTRTFNVGATVNLQRNEQDYLRRAVNDNDQDYSVVANLKAYTKSLQLRAQYAGIEGHQFQLNGNYTGRQLQGIAIAEPTWQVTAAWAWRLTPKLTLRTSVRDIFDSNVNRRRTLSDTVDQYSYSEQKGRVVTVGLSYSIGGVTGDSRLRNQGGMFRGPRGEGGEGGGPGGPGGGGWGGGGGGAGPGGF